MPLQTVGVAMSTYVAQNFGAKKFDRIKEGMRSILKIALSYSIFIGVLLWFTGHSLSAVFLDGRNEADRKSTRLNSSHVAISYAVFCLKKKNKRSTESMWMEKSYNFIIRMF